jgi:DNA-binding HxlR family transcriptional regulator
VKRVVGIIGDRWTLAVLGELQDGGRRYQELDEALDDVSHKVLTDLGRSRDEHLVALDRATVRRASDKNTSWNENAGRTSPPR